MAFVLVESITEFEPARRARGCFTLPAWRPFTPTLIAEAVGQLAAWVAMEQCGFASRPVAGIANECRFLAEPAPRAALELAIELESADRDAVAYSGVAQVGGTAILGLDGCVAPMLPMEEFDDPVAVKRRFGKLLGGGLAAHECSVEQGSSPRFQRASFTRDTARAALAVPLDAPYYCDHFPRKPVLPGTLLLDAMMVLGLELAARSGASAASRLPLTVRDVKLRSFLAPGTALELRAELARGTGGELKLALAAQAATKRIATASMLLSTAGVS